MFFPYQNYFNIQIGYNSLDTVESAKNGFGLLCPNEKTSVCHVIELEEMNAVKDSQDRKLQTPGGTPRRSKKRLAVNITVFC